MAEPDRVSALEVELAELRIQGTENHNLLQQIAQQLNLLPARPIRNTPSPAPSRIISEHFSERPRKKTSIRPSPPPDFNGDRAKGKAFLTSCRAYIRLVPEAFDDEAQQIVWAMTFMKSGRASNWAQRIFAMEDAEGLPFSDWFDFEQEFRKSFTPANAAAVAINKLEGSSYFQRSRSVDDYLDEFRDLVSDSGYTDPRNIIVKFRRGLDRRIGQAVAGMTQGRPSDVDLDAWYTLAVQIDQNRASDEAFLSSYRTASTPISPGIQPATRGSMLPVPKAPAVPFRYAHTTPSPGNPIPMDIDAARKKSALPQNCRRCGELGHWANDCPHRYDVRHMSTDEVQNVLEDMLARLDVVSEEPAEEFTPVPTEDFVPRNE
ncbi:hypothetical protein GALMADRAFT_82488 [Galerina marginata CBS 339.88]|uniref:CCHC-type domain-containing protein n=2 Tax=Galerina marginata (strain CBS 339.88) TaxID=685588 RepID=A0A067S2H2_GALM3|nr:hypothetical protein GALMADRAFT_82488 [Galerina marginata CBS 339.88]